MGAPHGPPPYVIKDRFGPLREWAKAAIWVVGFFGLLYGGARIFGGSSTHVPSLVVLSIFVVLFLAMVGIGFISENDPYLVVEPPGVRMDDAKIPWPSIRQLVVLTADGSGGPGRTVEIGVRLRFGAPLPDGMGNVIYDPRDPDALHCWNSIPSGLFDAGRLDAAVRAFAPPDVRVVADDPARVNRPSRPATSGPRQDTPATVLGVRMHDHGGSQAGNIHRYKPYPIVGFTLPDGRQVIAEVEKPGQGRPGEQVMVSYDADDPADVWVHGGKPKTIRRFTPMPGAS